MPISTSRPFTRARSAAGSRTAAFTRVRLGDIALTAAVTGVLLALTLSGLDPSVPSRHSLDLPRILLACTTAAPLIAGRRRPWGVFAATAVASVAFAAFGETVWLPAGLAAALYMLAGSRGTGTETPEWTPAGVSVVVSLLAAYLAVAATATGVNYGDLLHATLAFAVAWFAGERTRLRRVQLAELQDRADRTERAAARERDLAVAEERTRIARDLHDSAAHALNVIAVRAGAARLRHDPDRDLAALTAIEELARETMADIDHFVGSLRGADPARTPVEAPPGLAALDALVAQHRAGGHRIDLIRAGNQHQPLAVPVGHGMYRILQEALTNATRYGTGTVRVELFHLTDALNLTVSNTVRPARARPTTGGGHGVIGMRERAQTLGGQLQAGTAGNRYVVRARLPYTGRKG